VIRRGASPVTTSDRLTWAPKETEATLDIDLVDVFGQTTPD
jgi:hypothetical protein